MVAKNLICCALKGTVKVYFKTKMRFGTQAVGREGEGPFVLLNSFLTFQCNVIDSDLTVDKLNVEVRTILPTLTPNLLKEVTQT